jgi:hypothetical protein
MGPRAVAGGESRVDPLTVEPADQLDERLPCCFSLHSVVHVELGTSQHAWLHYAKVVKKATSGGQCSTKSQQGGSQRAECGGHCPAGALLAWRLLI